MSPTAAIASAQPSSGSRPRRHRDSTLVPGLDLYNSLSISVRQHQAYLTVATGATGRLGSATLVGLVGRAYPVATHMMVEVHLAGELVLIHHKTSQASNDWGASVCGSRGRWPEKSPGHTRMRSTEWHHRRHAKIAPRCVARTLSGFRAAPRRGISGLFARGT